MAIVAITRAPLAPARSSGADRIRSLDGLRGLAALVVVFHHELLTVPSLARAYSHPSPGNVNALTWWLTYTPLHLIWQGPEAVLIFFVLSGFVLALPARERSPRTWWAAYYARRLLRLYIPVVGSLVWALTTVALVHRHLASDQSFWTNAHATGAHGLGQAVHDSVLVLGTGWLNSPLWSLRSEVAFSLLLPIYMVLARRVATARLAQALALVATSTIGTWRGNGVLMYLPMFGLGVLLAMERERLSSLAGRVGRTGWWACLVLALSLLNSYWTLMATGGLSMRSAAAVGNACALGGATLLVAIFSEWSPARSAGENKHVQWLGQRSFSLYLTHEPLIVALTFLLGGQPNMILLVTVGTPASLLLAELFYRAVEAPSQRLARDAGQALKRKLVRAARATSDDGLACGRIPR